MTSFKNPKVYFGSGGFLGIGKIGKSPVAGARKPMVYGSGVRAERVLAGGGISRGGMVTVRSGAPSPRVVFKAKPEKRLDEFSKTIAEKEKEFVEADAKGEKFGEAEVRKSMMEMASEPMKTLPEEPEVSSPQERVEECVCDRCPPMDEHGNVTNPREGLTEAEERMVDFLDAAQEVIPELKKEDDAIPEPPPETEETIAERAEETRATLPELPLGEAASDETGKKRHRKRRGRKPRKSTEVAETERAAIRAEVEAASDAAASGQ